MPFFKRAQIAAADLALAGIAPADDLAELTLFADNLVPHVLRVDGVLEVDPELVARIESEQLLEHDSPEEVELRACALHAVELLVAAHGVDHRHRGRQHALEPRRPAALQGDPRAPPRAHVRRISSAVATSDALESGNVDPRRVAAASTGPRPGRRPAASVRRR